MISYKPKDWLTFIFHFHKADTVRVLLPMILVMCAYSGLIAYLELEVWELSKDSNVKNLTLLHNLLGFVLSMLLVFRTNSAYDRWWEGRKLWGALVNNSRNMAMKLNAYLSIDDATTRRQAARLITTYAHTLSKHLRGEQVTFELDSNEHPELEIIKKHHHAPNQVAALINKKINRLYKEGKISGDQLLALNLELMSFADICGACERIKNTPIPYSYSAFVKKFIFFYVMTLPFGFVFNLGYYVIPVVAFIFYVLASLELIAEEIEDPFDGDANDLPTDKIADGITKHVNEILLG
ncbi:bestrophin family protein [Lacibacter sp. MH-610]|uniref:bestrophin family protein n=1 Tax=Lacibacter sp. MH-610 TaxID=3020883 RepID=UPI0038922CA9